jgi:hypothetical protein
MGTITEEWQQAAAVFHGRVDAIRVPSANRTDSISSRAFPQPSTEWVRFTVLHAWKAPPREQLVVQDTLTNCRYGFQEGEEYLVWANPALDGLQTSKCSRTQPIADAGDQLTILLRGPPLAAREPWVAFTLVTAAGLAAGAWFAVRHSAHSGLARARSGPASRLLLLAPHPVLFPASLLILLIGIATTAFAAAGLGRADAHWIPLAANPLWQLGMIGIVLGWFSAWAGIRPHGAWWRGLVLGLLSYFAIGTIVILRYALAQGREFELVPVLVVTPIWPMLVELFLPR